LILLTHLISQGKHHNLRSACRNLCATLVRQSRWSNRPKNWRDIPFLATIGKAYRSGSAEKSNPLWFR